MRGRRRRRPVLTGALALLVALGVTTGAGAATASDASSSGKAPGQEVSWRAELGVRGGDDVGVRFTDGALRLRAEGVRPASAGGEGAQGAAVLPVRELGRTVHRVSVDLQARTPQGTRVAVDVRGRGAGGVWTEWREAAAGAPALLPRAATSVQARVTLFGMADGSAGPVVEGLRLSAEAVPASERAKERPQAAAAFSATVFATREGLVGHTTANGHVIQPNDHFVALPSRRGLSPKGSHEYSVRVCGPARCETAPVWDVGPWNTKDDYWNPSSVRQMWKDLPRGRPEAQAAYQDNYNGGADEFGRQVANPAGIDLADGTFYNVGLNNNGWVTVTYLWTDGGGGTPQLSFPSYSTLRDGSSGPQVSAAQHLLNTNGFDAGAVDGAFGPNTASAVRAFQQSRSLSVDGVVGPKTWTALLSAGSKPTLRQGDSGAAVERLQRALTAALGRTVDADGAFGPNTDDAVRDYQSSRGLGVDGIVGSGTWGALQAGR
ncbi:peptidoglycan-binding protein [Streptomyces sp. DSM 42041]|uniref:Peptidoglycan-binding protein n=1 Tax=Streptomyces hazeniae TaxID=3075538 RepID=A0ABU2NNQ0_9ACTN|nr:peptidoglycan-binding protein [Streptomyces sp. DSM 42041]MDT0378216.1 peptidoglycan-binding protein [Streptomyces sp. DSM 42041]